MSGKTLYLCASNCRVVYFGFFEDYATEAFENCLKSYVEDCLKNTESEITEGQARQLVSGLSAPDVALYEIPIDSKALFVWEKERARLLDLLYPKNEDDEDDEAGYIKLHDDLLKFYGFGLLARMGVDLYREFRLFCINVPPAYLTKDAQSSLANWILPVHIQEALVKTAEDYKKSAATATIAYGLAKKAVPADVVKAAKVEVYKEPWCALSEPGGAVDGAPPPVAPWVQTVDRFAEPVQPTVKVPTHSELWNYELAGYKRISHTPTLVPGSGWHVTDIYQRLSDETYWGAYYTRSDADKIRKSFNGLQAGEATIKQLVPQAYTAVRYVPPA